MSANDKAVATQQAPKAQIEMSDKGLQLTSMDDLYRFAQMVKRSGMVDGGRSEESIMISVQKGLEVGLSPLDAVHGIPTIKGRPFMEGKTFLALVQSRGVDDRRFPMDCGCRGEGAERVGWCKSWRKGWPESRESTFSWKEAVDAGLTSQRGSQPSIYKMYGNRMLQWKAVGIHGDKYYGDIKHGLVDQVTAEEVYASERDVTPPDIAAAAGLLPAPPDPLMMINGEPAVSDMVVSDAVRVDPVEPEDVAPEPTQPEVEPLIPDTAVLCSEDAEAPCLQEPDHGGPCDWEIELVDDLRDRLV